MYSTLRAIACQLTAGLVQSYVHPVSFRMTYGQYVWPPAVVFVDRYYRYKSVASEIPRDAWWYQSLTLAENFSPPGMEPTLHPVVRVESAII